MNDDCGDRSNVVDDALTTEEISRTQRKGYKLPLKGWTNLVKGTSGSIQDVILEVVVVQMESMNLLPL